MAVYAVISSDQLTLIYLWATLSRRALIGQLTKTNSSKAKHVLAVYPHAHIQLKPYVYIKELSVSESQIRLNLYCFKMVRINSLNGVNLLNARIKIQSQMFKFCFYHLVLPLNCLVCWNDPLILAEIT